MKPESVRLHHEACARYKAAEAASVAGEEVLKKCRTEEAEAYQAQRATIDAAWEDFRSWVDPGSPAFVIVPAPGDRCGGTGRLVDRTRCPGCRACS